MAKQTTRATSGSRRSTKTVAAKAAPAPDAAGRRKGILVRANPEAWKALKRIAIDQEMTLQDLMIEAINDVLQKHGKPPIA
jgi:hypothetical protein